MAIATRVTTGIKPEVTIETRTFTTQSKRSTDGVTIN